MSLCGGPAVEDRILGGLSRARPADDRARKILATVKDALCEKSSLQGEGENFT